MPFTQAPRLPLRVLRKLPGTLGLLAISTTYAQVAAPSPAPIDRYSIHADGGQIYDPLRREAEHTGQLRKYNSTPYQPVSAECEGVILEARVPSNATAYDVVPIPYSLRSAKIESGPSHVAATAFEDAKNVGDEPHYDLSLPGRIAVDFKYLGSVTAKNRPDRRHKLEADLSDRPAERFPSYDAAPQVRSGIVETGDPV